MLEGILPVNLLPERSMTLRKGLLATEAGICLVIWLSEIERKCKESLMFWGILPLSLLLDRSSKSMLALGRGMCPVKRFELNQPVQMGLCLMDLVADLLID